MSKPFAKTRTSPKATILLGVFISLLLLFSLMHGVMNGAIDISISDAISILKNPQEEWSPTQTILFQVRIPRVIAAALVGAGLAMSGLVMQTALKNPLAEPYLLGISSGASFGAVSVLIVGIPLALTIASFTGGLLALVATLFLGNAGKSPNATRVILAGIAVTSFFSALTSLVIFRSKDNDSYRQVLHWILGSLSNETWKSVGIAGLTLLVCGTILFITARLLDILLLADEEIYSIGKNAELIRFGVLVVASILAAGMVSVAGSIGFVGLIVPHIVRSFAHLSQRALLVISALTGALLLTLADTFSRTLFAPEELPVGITTAIVGSIVFAILMLRSSAVRP